LAVSGRDQCGNQDEFGAFIGGISYEKTVSQWGGFWRVGLFLGSPFLLGTLQLGTDNKPGLGMYLGCDNKHVVYKMIAILDFNIFFNNSKS